MGDNQKRLMEVLETALKRSDIIVLTGGLGPTKDDLTKETVALYLNLPLIVDDKSLKNIKRFFAERGRPFTENNFKQALIPDGAVAIENKIGTAPGILLNINGKIIILLPGPPKRWN